MQDNDHTLLARIDERVENIYLNFEKLTETVQDNSTRINKLENWRSYIVGVGALLSFLVTLLSVIVLNKVW
jgi:cell division protein FtsX